MHPSAASVARGAVVAIVIFLAAILGLVAGNVLKASSEQPAPGTGRVHANARGNIPDAAPAAGAPSYADPHLRYIQQAAEHAADPGFVQTWGNLDERRAAGSTPTGAAVDDAVHVNVRGNHADDEPPDASLTRPTIR